MEKEKIRVLKMFENKLINLKEAVDLLLALESSGIKFKITDLKDRELKILVYSEENNKKEKAELYFNLKDILVAGIMNKINTELRHLGIYLNMEEMRNIKDTIIKEEKFVLEKNGKKFEIWLE